jgi:hypothetical protein
MQDFELHVNSKRLSGIKTIDDVTVSDGVIDVKGTAILDMACPAQGGTEGSVHK